MEKKMTLSIRPRDQSNEHIDTHNNTIRIKLNKKFNTNTLKYKNDETQNIHKLQLVISSNQTEQSLLINSRGFCETIDLERLDILIRSDYLKEITQQTNKPNLLLMN